MTGFRPAEVPITSVRPLILSGSLASAQGDDLAWLAAGDLLHAIGPGLQSDPNFIGIIVPRIDAGDGTECSRDVIERPFDYRHRGTELLHAGGSRASCA